MIALVTALLLGASVESSLARLQAMKAEEKAIKKSLKDQGIVIKGKQAYRLVPVGPSSETSNVTPHYRVPTSGVPVRSRQGSATVAPEPR